MLRKTVLALALMVLSTTTLAAHDCGNGLLSGVAYSWCIDTPMEPSNPDVLYYLHGGGGNERSWTEAEDNQLIQEEWTRLGASAPTVITISFGTDWLLSQMPHGTSPSLYNLLVEQIMPGLEARIGGVHGRRLLKGESMGGFNSAQLLLKNGELFDRVALVCPGISIVGPYAGPAEIEAFTERNKAFLNKEWFQGIMNWARAEFPTPQDWAKHDPLALIQSTSRLPSLYVSCGEKDDFGFYEGARLFAERAVERNVRVTWQPLPGGHCVSDPKAIAQFLAR